MTSTLMILANVRRMSEHNFVARDFSQKIKACLCEKTKSNFHFFSQMNRFK